MQLNIITPEKSLFSGEVKLIRLPGAEGSFELLESHAPIVAALGNGDIKIIDAQNNKSYFSLKGGIAECSNNKVIVLAE